MTFSEHDSLCRCPLFEYSDNPNSCIRGCHECQYEIVPCIVCGELIQGVPGTDICDECIYP